MAHASTALRPEHQRRYAMESDHLAGRHAGSDARHFLRVSFRRGGASRRVSPRSELLLYAAAVVRHVELLDGHRWSAAPRGQPPPTNGTLRCGAPQPALIDDAIS